MCNAYDTIIPNNFSQVFYVRKNLYLHGHLHSLYPDEDKRRNKNKEDKLNSWQRGAGK